MRELLIVSYIIGSWCFSREVISTNHSTGMVRYTTSSDSAHLLAIEYPSCIVPYLISTPLYKIFESRSSIIAVFYLKGRTTLDIFYEKELSKVWECSPYIDEGVVIRAVGCTNKQVVWIDAMVDWAVIPDFTVQFVSFNIFGVLFTLLLKTYSSTDNVFGKRVACH